MLPDDERTATPLATTRSFAYAGRDSVDLAEDFHEASKIAPLFPGARLGPSAPYFLTVPDAPWRLGTPGLQNAGPLTPLPRAPEQVVGLRGLVHGRRSGTADPSARVMLSTLGAVLDLSAATADDSSGRRVYPSAGALYPIDVVVMAHDVADLDADCYVYDPAHHGLRGLPITADGFHGSSTAGAPVPEPAVTLALVATFARSRAKYGLRGYRFTLIEAGHLAHAVCLAAAALGLQCLPRGGYADSAVDGWLDLDGVERSCVYLVGITAAGPDL